MSPAANHYFIDQLPLAKPVKVGGIGTRFRVDVAGEVGHYLSARNPRAYRTCRMLNLEDFAIAVPFEMNSVSRAGLPDDSRARPGRLRIGHDK